MEHVMNVNDAMTTPAKCCTADASLEEIARMMWQEDCGAIPVVDERNQPIGIVTDRDIAMSAMFNREPLWKLTAAKVIQGQRLVCCNPQDSIENCLEKMKEGEVRRILVTGDDGAVCGILSMGDAVAFASSAAHRDTECAINSGHVLGMLRSVSGHHDDGIQAAQRQ
jgi:CBS domain-containing protein